MRSKARGAALLAGALLLLPAGGVGFLHWKAQLTIDGFEAETRHRRDALGHASRGPLWDPIEGSAREEYLAAGRSEPLDVDALRRALRMPFTGSDDLRKPLQSYLAALDAAAMNAWNDGRVDEALESLGVAAGVAQDLTRLGETGHLSTLWRRMIETRGATAAALRVAASRLEALERHAPSLPPWIERQFLDFREMVYRDVEPAKFNPSKRSWRNLWSASIARADALNAHERVEALFLDVAESPPSRAQELLESPPRVDLDSFQELGSLYAMGLMPLALSTMLASTDREHARFLRLGLAVARFETERGRYPASLEELLPAYLPKLPDLGPVHYSDGTLRMGGPADPSEIRIRRDP